MTSTAADMVAEAKASIENLNPEGAFAECESGVATVARHLQVEQGGKP
jgi:hypothetical protein